MAARPTIRDIVYTAFRQCTIGLLFMDIRIRTVCRVPDMSDMVKSIVFTPADRRRGYCVTRRKYYYRDDSRTALRRPHNARLQ